MTLKFDDEGMVDRNKLNKTERKIFVAFLRSEIHRHRKDIVDIWRAIEDMKEVKE